MKKIIPIIGLIIVIVAVIGIVLFVRGRSEPGLGEQRGEVSTREAGLSDAGSEQDGYETSGMPESEATESPERNSASSETELGYKSALQSVAIQTFEETVEAPNFKLNNLEGGELSLADLEGKLVLLNFWASWCGPCNIEKPSMEKLYQELKEEGLVIVGVNLREDKSTAEDFVEKHDISFPILLDKTGEISGMYGVRSIPTSYLIGRNGKALGGVLGAREWDEDKMVSTLKKLLEAGV